MPPFNAQSLHQLAQKIIQGKYQDVPAHFSKNIPNLLSAMLNKDPNKRPNINGILRFPIIQERVRMLLNEDDFKEEFSHTLLHGQNVFDEFRAKQAEAKAKAARDKAAAEEQKELQEKMMKLQISDTNYRPKNG